MIWFTADTHFGHEAIIGLSKRPFKDMKEMDEELIRRWNERVKPKDVVIFLGDFAYKSINNVNHYRKQLNGNIIFIKGNHDKNSKFGIRIMSMVIDYNEMKIFCIHNPTNYSRHPVHKINLVGHVHDNWKAMRLGNKIIVNVGVDVWDYYPVNLKQILKYTSTMRKKIKSIEYRRRRAWKN